MTEVLKLFFSSAQLNSGTVGFYRVHYPSEILAQFLPAIESKQLPPLDRLGLVDDIFALVQSGQASTVDVSFLKNSCN
jgi:puromycin-sensitive aminopeptidase